MIIKIVLISLVIFMLFNLFKALYLMTKNDPDAPSMSMLIIAIVLVGVAAGIITPNTPPY